MSDNKIQLETLYEEGDLGYKTLVMKRFMPNEWVENLETLNG